MKEDHPLNPERLREVYSYDSNTGIFTRKEKPFRKKCGGLTHNGYLKLSVDATRFRAHRLAWLYHYGAWPNGWLDHKNGDRLDNRITNLRVADKSLNGVNRGKSKASTSGFKGVTFDKKSGCWRAQIGFRGKNIFVGDFSSPKQAHKAYEKKGMQLFGEFFRAS